jgi:hypothetical protein
MDPKPKKKLKPIPAFIREDAPFGHSKVYDLIKDGTLKTVRLGGRQYIVMESFERLIPPA